MKRFFNKNNESVFVTRTRSLTKKAKDLTNKSIAKTMSELVDSNAIEYMDDETSVILKDSLALINESFDYIEVLTDMYEEREKQFKEMERMVRETNELVKKLAEKED